MNILYEEERTMIILDGVMQKCLRMTYMTKAKFLSLILVLLTIFSLFAGCSNNNKYNAVLYSNANEWIDETFLNDNRVKAYYLNENYIDGQSDPNDKYIYDTTSPSSRVFTVSDEAEYNRIFSNSPMNIDFEYEMVILYIFSDVYPEREYKLKKIEVNGEVLIVKTELEQKNVDDAAMPYQRCIALKMNKVEINEVKFE